MNANLIIVMGTALFLGGAYIWKANNDPRSQLYEAHFKMYEPDECYEEKQVGKTISSAAVKAKSQETMPDTSRIYQSVHSSGDVPDHIQKMPELVGFFGPNLREALAADEKSQNKLNTLVRELMELSFPELFLPRNNVQEKVKNVVFVWYGVDRVDPNSRGPFIDARELMILEQMSNSPFLQLQGYPNPAPYAAMDLKKAFDILLDNYYLALLAQMAGEDFLYSEYLQAKRRKSQVSGQGNEPLLSNLLAFQTLSLGNYVQVDTEGMKRLTHVASQLPTVQERKAFWQNVLHMTTTMDKKYINSSGFQEMMNRFIQDSDPALTYEQVKASIGFPENASYADGKGMAFDREGKLVTQLVVAYYDDWRKICYKTANRDDPSLPPEVQASLKQ